jgi:hypothetical protein
MGAASDTIVELSTPPDRCAPTGTSLRSCSRTASCSNAFNCSVKYSSVW